MIMCLLLSMALQADVDQLRYLLLYSKRFLASDESDNDQLRSLL